MTDQEMRIMDQLHDVQYKLLQEFDTLCEKHDIRYYLAAGTLLGAVRHQNFIPWDDDVDVYLPRKEFAKFMKHIGEFQSPFEVHCPGKHDQFFWDYTTRLVYKNSRLKFDQKESEFYEHKNTEYLFLDIFVLDKAHAGIRNKLQLFKLKVIYGLAMSRRFCIDYSEYSSIISKMQVFILAHVGRLFSMERLYKMYFCESTRYNNDSHADYEQPTNITVKFLGSLFYDKEWHQDSTTLLIREGKFPVPKKYKEVLKSVYSDYMKLPPIEKQIPEHVGVLDEIEIN